MWPLILQFHLDARGKGRRRRTGKAVAGCAKRPTMELGGWQNMLRPAHANTGDPDGPSRPVVNEVARALISMMVWSKTAPTRDRIHGCKTVTAGSPNPLATHGRIIHKGQLRRFGPVLSTSGLPQLRTSRCTERGDAMCHVWTAPGWQGLFSRCRLGRCSHVFGLQMRFHMTAGHNALRGSGPGQNPAFDDAMAQVGCPDRRIDRLCITCC